MEDLSLVDPTVDNPSVADSERSVNNRLRRAGAAPEVVFTKGFVEDDEDRVDVEGFSRVSADVSVLVDGLEFDSSGVDRRIEARTIDDFPTADRSPLHVVLGSAETDGRILAELVYPKAFAIEAVRFVEGPAVEGEVASLGAIQLEARVDGQWRNVDFSFDEPSSSAFALRELRFDVLTADALRLSGAPTAGRAWVSLCEIDAVIAVP